MGLEKRPLKQRKLPSQARSKVTRDMIITAAAHILEHQGEAGLTTNHVAEKAGASIGSVYQYFSSKEDIVLALAEREENLMLHGERLEEQAIYQEQSPLRLGLRAYINMLPDNPKARKSALETVIRERGVDRIASDIDAKFKDAGMYSGLSKEESFVLSRAIVGTVQAAVREELPYIKGREFEDALVHLTRGFLREVV
jgi:AcrR family transcriptional regulator